MYAYIGTVRVYTGLFKLINRTADLLFKSVYAIIVSRDI